MNSDAITHSEDRLRRLVEIESPTGHRSGIAACQQLINSWIAPSFGRDGTLRTIDGVDHLHWSARRSGGVLLLGHIDTVWPLGTLKEIPCLTSDHRMSGPGTFDMKAGLVAVVGALEMVGDLDDISLLITSDEEVGSTTSRALIEESAQRSSVVLVAEPSLNGALKVARRGAAIYRLDTIGRSAHAGLEPELGANALIEISHQVLHLSAIGDDTLGTTVTPTVSRSGSTVNTVPEHAEAHVDVRAWSRTELERVDRQVRALASVDPAITLSVSGGINRLPLQRELTQPLFEMARAVAERYGLPRLEGAEVGGGSDGNFTAALGIPTLDGLGPLGDGAHAPYEWVDLRSVVQRTRLIAGLIEQLRITPVRQRHSSVAEGEVS